jgi:hypothetical protein
MADFDGWVASESLAAAHRERPSEEVVEVTEALEQGFGAGVVRGGPPPAMQRIVVRARHRPRVETRHGRVAMG